MPIKRTTGFTTSDGSLCATLEEAQRHELALVWFKHSPLNEACSEAEKDVERTKAIEFAHLVHDNVDAILDILTTGPRSRPAARKSKGTTNPKRAAKATPEVARAGLRAMRAAADGDAEALRLARPDEAYHEAGNVP